MAEFSSSDLEAIKAERRQADTRFEKALADARVIGSILNQIHRTRYSESFWLYLLLPLVQKHQIRLYQQELSERRRARCEGEVNRPLFQRFAALRPVIYSALKTVWRNSVARSRYAGFKRKLLCGKVFVYAFHEPPKFESEAIPLLAALPALFPHRDRQKRREVSTRARALADEDQKAILHSLPEYLVETFTSLIRHVPLTDPANKEFHVSIGHVDFMSLVLALHFEQGAKIIRYQHGSHYGEQAYFDSVERHNCTEFHTWGWRILKQDVPDRAFRLEGFLRRYGQYESAQTIDLLMCFPALHDNNINSISSHSLCILKGIDRKCFETVVARPRPMARFGNFRKSLEFLEDREIVIDSGKGDIARLVKKSRLVVHLEVPSTTFLECMHVDHPVMGIYFNLRPTKIVLPFYQFFFRVGVLHITAESLVNHLNSISDVSSWWTDVQAHEEYHAFKAQFCGQFVKENTPS